MAKKRLQGFSLTSHDAVLQVQGEAEKKISAALKGLQAKYVYKIVVTVNAAPFLWTRPLRPVKSSACEPYKAVQRRRVKRCEDLDKFLGSAKPIGSAQTLPVDIKNLIHRWGLDFRLRSGKLASLNEKRRG